jgi:hypothetical protein
MARPQPEPERERVLTRALLRASPILGLSQKDVGSVLGVSDASVSRLFGGSRTIDPETKEGELALLLLRVFRSLDALVGGKEEAVRAWMHAENRHLAGVPAERIRSVEGLVHVAEYLDAMRGTL